jgi:2,3-bisphosphoglycerate-dependent phosphoglycerate mutase
MSEARAAGVLLKERGWDHFDKVFTSELSRAKLSCELALEEIYEHSNATIPRIETAWKLNERHYGALQGRQKQNPELLRLYGKEKLAHWRRDFHAVPPPMDPSHKHYQAPPAPLHESLAHCQDRVLSYWEDAIKPTLKESGKNVLLVAHSNTLRALVAHLDQIPTSRVPNIHIPNSVPCLYSFNLEGEVVSSLPMGTSRGEWLFSIENRERLRNKIGGSSAFARAIFAAWDLNGDGVLTKEELQVGLTKLKGEDDISMAAIAGKILEEVDQDGNQTLDLQEFQHFALEACNKFIPGLLQD